MLRVYGICERCKLLVELTLSEGILEHEASVDVKLVLTHKPKFGCGGRIKPIVVNEVRDESARTMLPLELWQMLYEEGMSLRELGKLTNSSSTKIRGLLAQSNYVETYGCRRRGRPRKSDRMEVRNEKQNIANTAS